VSTSNALQYKIALNFFSKKCYTQKKSFLLNFSTPKKIKNPHTIHFGKFYKIFPFYFLVGFIFKFFFRELREGMCQQIMLAAVLGRKNPSLAFIPVVEALSRRLLSIRGLYQNPDSTQCTRHQ